MISGEVKVILQRTIRDLFSISFIFYALLLFLELLKPGFVSYFFNPHWVLIIALISAIIILVMKKKQ